jgi:hypothetical protein
VKEYYFAHVAKVWRDRFPFYYADAVFPTVNIVLALAICAP